MFKKIFIVAGHGKSNGIFDPGTTYRELTERAITVDVAQKVTNYLGDKAIGIGISEDLTVEEKTNAINQLCTAMNLDHTNSLLLSLHVDYYQAPTGLAAFYYGGSTESQEYAQALLSSISQAVNKPIRWNKPDTDSRFGRLGIVRDTTPLAMLLEMGSIKEDDVLLTEGTKIARSIAAAVREFAQWPTQVIPEPEPGIDEAMELISSAWHDFDTCEKLCIEGKQKLHEANNILRSIS